MVRRNARQPFSASRALGALAAIAVLLVGVTSQPPAAVGVGQLDGTPGTPLASPAARIGADAVASVAAEIARLREATPPPVGVRVVPLSVTIPEDDIPTVVDGGQAATDVVRAALAEVRADYEGVVGPCQVAAALAFGHRSAFTEASVVQGQALAEAVNAGLSEAFGELMIGTKLVAYGDLSPPDGQVDLELHAITPLDGGPCRAPATPTGQATPAA